MGAGSAGAGSRFAQRARDHGVRVTKELYDDMPHVWHLFPGMLPEADQALDAIGRWLAASETCP